MNGPGFVVALRLEGWAFGGGPFCCGIGPRRARRETERWLRTASPAAVINVGICGGMLPGLASGGLVLVDGWVDGPDADPALHRELGARLGSAGVVFARGRAITVEAPLIRPLDKERAHRESGATICEMEGLAIAEACAEAGVPFAALRAVADDLETVLRRPPRMAVPLTRALLALRGAGAAVRTGAWTGQGASTRRARSSCSSGT